MLEFLYLSNILSFVYRKRISITIYKWIKLVTRIKIVYSGYIDDCLYYDDDFLGAFTNFTLAMYSENFGHAYTWPMMAETNNTSVNQDVGTNIVPHVGHRG